MRTPLFEIYRDRKKEFRWRLRAANGRVIADSAEGYRTKRACLQGVHRVGDGLMGWMYDDSPLYEDTP